MATDYTQHANCVAAWLFKEGSGTSVADSSSASNTGTFKGSGEPAWSSDVPTYGQGGTPLYSVQFDGSDDLINCGTSNTILPQSGAFTVVMWVKATIDGTQRRVIDRGNVHLSALGSYPRFDAAGSTTLIRAGSNNSLTDGAWRHLAMTWDGSTTAANVNIYVNASEITYQNTTNGATLSANSGSTTYLGNRHDGARCYNGYLTEVAVFNAVLTSDNITEIYNYGLTGSVYVPRIMVLV